MDRLEEQFTEAMFQIYRRAKSEASYNAKMFLQMISRQGGLRTAKTLINSAKPSNGYTALFELGRLDLTVEALVVEDVRWRSLFTQEELARAHRRLQDYEYQPVRRNVTAPNT